MASKSDELIDALKEVELESTAPPEPPPAPVVTPEALTSTRAATHGDWNAQSALFDNLMWQLTNSTHWFQMNHMQRGALTNIAQKMSRICTGNPYEPDHWDDIAGYAYLGKGGHKA